MHRKSNGQHSKSALGRDRVPFYCQLAFKTLCLLRCMNYEALRATFSLKNVKSCNTRAYESIVLFTLDKYSLSLVNLARKKPYR